MPSFLTKKIRNKMKVLLLGVALVAIAFTMQNACGVIITTTNPMLAGVGGYPVYRIPAFAVASDGSLMLFAEGRPSSLDPGGPGDIDLVFTRSTDGGVTWSPIEVLHARKDFDYSDPRVIVDRLTEKVHLQYVQWPTGCGQTCVPTGLGDNSSVIYYQTSADHGDNWSSPININDQVKDSSWASLNTGPGLGIQLQWQDAAPARNGRLLIPGHRRPNSYRGVAIYSDDGGVTWTHGTGVTPHFSDESEVIELTNGDLLWDARRSGAGRNRSISHDGGATWVEVHDGDIPISAVDGALVRYSAARAGQDRDRILFSSPLGNPVGSGNDRSNIGIWTSYDEGRTFINPVQIQSGSAAYSVLDRLQDGTIGLVYEVSHQTVRYINFDLAHLEKALHPVAMSHYDGFGNSIDAFRGGVGWSGSWQNNNVHVAPGILEFPGYLTEGDGQHAHLNGGDMTRHLGNRPIDLNAVGETYFSLFVRRDSSETSTQRNEFLDILLQNGDGQTQAAFGVGSSENFFINEIGGAVSSNANALEFDKSYLVLAKLSTSSDGDGTAFDQLFLTWYDDPLEVPAEESAVTWQLVGHTNENASGKIEQLVIRGGSNADWRIDGLRIGTSFDAVIVDTGVERLAVLGDLNGDYLLDIADWIELKSRFRLDTSSMDEESQLSMGDFDHNGSIGMEDLVTFRDLFAAVHGQDALGVLTNRVPEPSSFLLLGGIVATIHLRSTFRRHWRSRLALVDRHASANH